MITKYTSENLRYLRNGVGLDINNLADLIGIDPIDLYLFEKDDFSISQNTQHTIDLAEVASYFTIYLDDLIYSDLKTGDKFNESIFLELKAEWEHGIQYDRTIFKNSLTDVKEEEIPVQSSSALFEEFNQRMEIIEEAENIKKDRKESDKDDLFKLEVVRNMLRLIHTASAQLDKYYALRKEGLTGRIDLFEES